MRAKRSRYLVTEELIEKAHEVLFPKGAPTGWKGLTRKQLRALERAGVVESKLMMNKDTGSWRRIWNLRGEESETP